MAENWYVKLLPKSIFRMVQDEKMYLVISHLIQSLNEFRLFPEVLQANSLTQVVHFKDTTI